MRFRDFDAPHSIFWAVIGFLLLLTESYRTVGCFILAFIVVWETGYYLFKKLIAKKRDSLPVPGEAEIDEHGDKMAFREASRFIKRGDIIALRDALDPNCSNKYEWSLLMIAAKVGNIKIGELLISKGADVNKVQKNNWTALSLAAMSGHIPFIELLLKHGALNKLGMPIKLKYSGLSEEKIELIYKMIGEKVA